MSKMCSKCKEIKDDSEFYIRSDKRHLLKSRCKSCILDDRKIYRLDNIEKFKEKDKKYHIENRDKRIKYSKYWNDKNKNHRNEYSKIKYNNDLDFKLMTNIRNRIRMAIKRNTKSNFTLGLIGCSIDELKKYLEINFKEYMTWDNYGEWQIDHIIPCSKFNLSNENEQKKCFNYSNLQPLWKEENRAKGNKILN